MPILNAEELEQQQKRAEQFGTILRYQQRRGIHSADADGERLATKRVKPPRVVNTSRASEIPCKWVVRDTTPDMQQSLAKRPRVSKANHGTKATETSGRGPATPIKRSDLQIEASQARSCLVDQRDRTPKQYPNSGRNDGNEQSGDAKGKKPAHTGRASHMAAQHHPFSQVQKIGQPVVSAPVWLNDTLLVTALRIKTMLMEGMK
ncbi:hypothetical protein EDC04DRAFT_2605082 [Pisolithus marmoratus]|nr:hypothetical protein EDC04DRAFT_2605082 [Pisolithus marmoratus]